MKFSKLIAVAALVLAPFTASASTMGGTLSLSGDVTSWSGTSNTDITVDFAPTLGAVISGSGDLLSLSGGPCLGCVTANDFTNSATGVLFSVGNLAFTSTSFKLNTTGASGMNFTVAGYFSDTSGSPTPFDNTNASAVFSISDTGILVNYSAVSAVPVPAAGFLLLGGLSGLGAVAARRRKQKAA